MLHEPASQSGPDPAESYKMKLGVLMFFIYGAVYVGFVAINVVKPELMETILPTGMNLATVYGIGLIVFALFLAVIYNHLCTTKEKAMAAGEEGE